MEEIATLVIRVQSDQTENAKRRLKELGYTAKETETATGGLMSKWKAMTGLLAGTVGIGTAIAGLNKLLDTAKRFESLEAQLKTATGSAENAVIAFQAIQDFATQTPYDLAQSTEAFIKLVNLGLTPSERALRSYGDTASAMGKDLRTMVQAVANATTGEFEILKQFGVKARTEADGISFSFRGTTTKVKNDAKSIEEYFIALGEKNFGGAMAERMATLEGKLSNLGDAWDVLFATIAKAGAGDLMKGAIDIAISAVQELTDLIASGQLAGYVEALLFKFESLADGVYNAFSNISDLLDMVFEYWSTDGKGAVDFIIDAFKNMPENIRMYMRATGATWGVLVEYASAAGKGIYEAIAGYFDLLISTAVNVGKEIYSNLNPAADDFDFIGAQAKAMEEFASRTSTAWDDTVQSINNATDAWTEEIVAGMDERDASLAAFDEKIKKADELRAAYERIRAERLKASEGQDRLAGFGTGTKGTTAEFDKLRESLRTQEQVIADSYAKRKQLILDNTAAEDSLRAELLARLETSYAEERTQLLDKAGLDIEVRATALEDAQAIEMQILVNGYTERQKALDDALEARLISEEDYARRSKQLEERRTRDVNKLATESFAQVRTKQLGVYADVLEMAANIANQMSGLVEGNNRAANATFIAAKAISIAQAIVYTELAAVRALAEGGTFAGIPLSTLIRATGYASVALMTATAVQEYGGKFEHGGMIPAGKVGMTQEAGFELVRGPAVVTSARATADLLGGNQSGGGANVQVIVNNQTDAQATVEERDGPDGKIIEILVKRTSAQLAADVRNGGNVFSSALQSTFNLRRGVA